MNTDFIIDYLANLYKKLKISVFSKLLYLSKNGWLVDNKSFEKK